MIYFKHDGQWRNKPLKSCTPPGTISTCSNHGALKGFMIFMYVYTSLIYTHVDGHLVKITDIYMQTHLCRLCHEPLVVFRIVITVSIHERPLRHQHQSSITQLLVMSPFTSHYPTSTIKHHSSSINIIHHYDINMNFPSCSLSFTIHYNKHPFNHH